MVGRRCEESKGPTDTHGLFPGPPLSLEHLRVLASNSSECDTVTIPPCTPRVGIALRRKIDASLKNAELDHAVFDPILEVLGWLSTSGAEPIFLNEV